MKKVLGFSFAALMLASCGTVGIVSTPTNYVKAGKEVSITTDNLNILGLTAMNAQKETKKALTALAGKCTNGVTNVTTTVSFKNFSIFGFEKLEITGNCK